MQNSEFRHRLQCTPSGDPILGTMTPTFSFRIVTRDAALRNFEILSLATSDGHKRARCVHTHDTSRRARTRARANKESAPVRIDSLGNPKPMDGKRDDFAISKRGREMSRLLSDNSATAKIVKLKCDTTQLPRRWFVFLNKVKFDIIIYNYRKSGRMKVKWR